MKYLLERKNEITWCMLRTISEPPMNSPLMNICGNVGQRLHSQKRLNQNIENRKLK